MVPLLTHPPLRVVEATDSINELPPIWLATYFARIRAMGRDLELNELSIVEAHPDIADILDVVGFEHCVDAVIERLWDAHRPSAAFLLAIARYASLLSSSDTIVICLRRDQTLKKLLEDIKVTARVIIFENSLQEIKAYADLPPNWSIILGNPTLILEAIALPNLALALIDDIYWDSTSWRYFGPQRVLEQLASDLQPNGLIVVKDLPSEQLKSTVLNLFLSSPPHSMIRRALLPPHLEAALEAQQIVVLQREPDSGANVGEFGLRLPCRARLTHVNDVNAQVGHIDELQTDLSADSIDFKTYHIEPARNVSVQVPKNSPYCTPGENDWYFTASYTTLPLSITRADDALLGGFNVFFVLSKDGKQIIDRHYADYLCQTGVLSGDIQRYGNEIRRSGEAYCDDFQLHTNPQTGGIFLDRIVAKFDTPVFLLHHRWLHHFGHFVHEILPAALLWKKYLRPLNIPIVSQINRPWQFELLATIGISKDELIDIQYAGVYHCKSIYFSHSLQDQNYNFLPEMTLFARESELAKPRWPKTRKIYAARTDTPFRRIQNEVEVIQALKSVGFEIVVGSTLSPSEQIRAFREARLIVGAHGSNLTNLIFGDEQTIFLELLNERFFDPFYMRLSNLAGLQYDHLRFPCSDPSAASRDAEGIVNIDELLARVHSLDTPIE